jgi:hypothetical protein
MSRTCIVCGKRAGSAEHVFPAALGGRRTNKGIYCGKHNNGFSGLAAEIASQLKPINALLVVRPDHSKKAEPFNYTSPEGEGLVIFDGSVTRASSNAPPSEDDHHIHLMFGGPDGLKAIAYIALTFFAHHFPDHARKPGTEPIKDFLTTHDFNEFVWWESDAILASLPPNKYPFGHTIALMTFSTGAATVYVSLFGSLNFGVALGIIESISDESVVVFIDPQADHPPDDISVTKTSTILLALKKPEPLHANLEKTIREGLGQTALTRLLQKIEEWKFNKDMAPVLERLNAVGALPSQDRRVAIEVIVQEEANRIYRVMRILADQFAATRRGDPVADRIISALQAMVAVSGGNQPTLSADGQRAMATSFVAVVDDLVDKIGLGRVGMDYLWSLFSGGYGAGIVWNIMTDIIQESI